MDNRVGFIPKCLEPLYSFLSSEPGELPFCVVTNIKLGLLNGALNCAMILKILNDAPISMRAQGIRFRRNTTLQQGLNLVHESSPEMLFCALINPFIKRITRRIERNDSKPLRAFVGFRAFFALRKNRRAGLQVHFDCSLYPRPIAGVKLFGSGWIYASEHAVQILGPTHFSH